MELVFGARLGWKILTNMLSVLARSLHLRMVVRTRERFLAANQLLVLAMVGVEQLDALDQKRRRAVETIHLGTVMVCFKHDRGVSKFLDKAVLPLNG